MEISKIRKMKVAELQKTITDQQVKIQKLSLDRFTSEVKDVKALGREKKLLAKLKTVLNETKLEASNE